MRKKISNILMGILLIFAGVFVSACGDKYKDFKFKISYAFSESAETWYDANKGISLNYDVDDKGTPSDVSDDEYIFSINGKEERVNKNNFNIYLKAEVKNVKSKYLDSITISAEGSSGLAFTSSTIKNNKVVKLPVVGLVNSKLSLYENKSGKSTKIDLTVYGKIKNVTRNDAITPAIVADGTLDLNSIRDLIFYNKDGITTNQTGVTYEIVDFGSFTGLGNYQADSLANNQLNRQFLSLTNAKLKLNNKIRTSSGEKVFAVTANNNVLRIKATSKYSPADPTADNPEIADYIYVYVIDNNLTSPIVTFDGTETNVNDPSLTQKGLDLYFNSSKEESLNKYTNSTVQVSGIDGVYKNGITTADGRTLKFNVKAYVGNSYIPYEFGSDIPVRNLKTSENGDKYNIALASQSAESKVDVKFAYELVCEKDGVTYPVTFTNSKPVLETKVEVRKHILASSIVINGEEYVNGDILNGVVYSTSAEKYAGFKAELGIEPIDVYNPQNIKISGVGNLNVINKKGFKVNNEDKLSNGEVLNIKFASGVYNDQEVKFEVLKTPTYFNGQDVTDAQYILVKLGLTRKVTADALEFVDGNDYTKTLTTINVATTAQSYVFVKAYYKGELDASTITLTSDKFALNANGDKKITLTNETQVVDGNNDKGYKIFKIAIPATKNLSTSKLEVYAGEYGNGASSTATLNAVDLINNPANITISVKENENVKDLTNNKFAVVKGKEVLFNVVEEVDGTKVENTIQKIALRSKTITGTHADKFGDAEVLTKTEFGDNTFSVYGWNAKTRVFDVDVQYYAQDGNGVVVLQTKIIENVQFGVYNPITSITIVPTKYKIAYVNSEYIGEASTTEITYTLHSSVGTAGPTDVVYFIDEGGSLDSTTGANATSVNVSISRDLTGPDYAGKVKLFYSTGATYVELKNTGTTLREKVVGNGSVKLQLINSIDLNNVKFVVTANRFGVETAVANDVNIIIGNVEKATGINIVDGDIKEYSNENRELQLSFMGVDSGEIYKTFVVEPVFENKIPDANTLQFKDLVWELYKYDYVDGNWVFNPNNQITDFTNNLSVVENNGAFIVTADKSITDIGGLYKLIISTKDSYGPKQGGGYEYGVQWSLDIRVSDGKLMPYIITSADEFVNIDTDLSANYVLGNNITVPASKLSRPIGFDGSTVAPFTGSLSGRLTTSASEFNFNLNVTIGNGKINIGEGTSATSLYGLFSILGEEGRISNLNINIAFSGISTESASTIGGIVAVNKGIIENVNVTVAGEISINNATNFGGIVGLNETLGEIKNCIVNYSSQGLTINSIAASDIGGMVGQNDGVITGKYSKKEDLNEIKYDNIVNITINNTADNIAYNIGAVAGTSSTDIKNMLVGGQIKFNSSEALDDGYLAGIVGSTSANVETVAVVGLDLINAGKNGIKVAGIAGIAENGSEIKDIKDARYVSVLAKFSGFETTGQLVGKDVAGISHKANVTYSTVESFIKTTENAAGVKSTFYTFEGETVYGLIVTGSVSNSFVSANINATTVFLTSANENKDATYFIGKVNGDTITDTDIKSTYAVVINEENTNATLYGFNKLNAAGLAYYVDTSTTPNTLNSYWEGLVIDIDNNGVDDGFAIDENINILKVSDYEGINFYLPYIFVTLEDGSTTPLMILQPDSIKAEINQDYKIDVEENVYVGNADIKDDKTPPTYEIKESIFVDFFTNEFDNYANSGVNTHRLVNILCEKCKEGHFAECLKDIVCGDCDNCKASLECTSPIKCNDGLIDLTLLPADVTAGLTFELVANYGDIAQFDETGTYLILTGMSASKPIILRAYSMFNPEAEAYFAIYSQRTYSELILEGANVTKQSVNNYSVNVYQGRNSTISLTADNFKGGESYDSILTNNSHLVKVVATLPDSAKFTYGTPAVEEYKIEINTNNLSSMIFAININYTVQGLNDSTTVTLNVYLDKEYFNGLTADLLLGTINLTVNLNDVATKLDIVGANDFEIDSSSTVNFVADLKTGFKNAIDNQECVVTVDDNGIVIIDGGNVNSKDSIRMNIYSTSAELNRIKTETGANSYAKLFNFDVYETKNADGYKYEVSLSLKDEFNYRYVTENIDLVVNIWAASNPNVMNAVNITIKPTTANTIRLDNYAVESVNVVSNTRSELTIGQVETSIISPGGRGNMLLAYVEKSYSNIDSISITSSDLFVPELNRNVNLVFTQYVYNKVTCKFETLFNSNVQAQNGKTLELQKATTIENGKTEYTGILYIHAQLVKVSGLEARITATLNVVSNGTNLPAETASMLTTFLPGASLSYNGIAADNGGYLVQESTYGNTARIKLYGYQFNSNPTMLVDWELDNGSNYKYVLNADNSQIDLSSLTDTNGNSSTEDEKIALLKPYSDKGELYYLFEGKYYKAVEAGDLSKSATFYSIKNKKLIWIDENNNNIVDGSEQSINIANYVSTYFLKQYDKVDYNPVDGSYSMDVLFNIAKDIPANFSLQAKMSLITSDGHFEDSYSEKIMFYPTKYVVTDISVKDTSGNRKMLAINRTDKFEFLFSTLRGDYDYSRVIYDEIFTKQLADLKALFSYYDPTEKTFNNENTAFSVEFRNDFLSITGLSTFEKEITLKVYVGYVFENGKYKLVFGEQGASNVRLLTYSFTLQIYPGATEENANPIYSASDMFDEGGNSRLAANGHYILMNDITVDLVKPIENIGSLDGNNHVIKIKNFVIDPSKTEYGLFANIGTYQDEEGKTHKSILKNVIVDYSEFNVENSGNIEFINNNMTTINFGGLVATNNGGLIYNCDVVNSNAASDKVINILVDENASITFGGLVATNSGIITNSRVGRRDFKDVDAVNDTYVNTTFGGLQFVLGNETKSGFDAIAGGFVGENSGTISSSYFANSSLISYSNSNETNLTAGFAGINNSGANIVYSYVKAKETTITSTQPYATGNRIENKSNGIVAGFVYENAGIITDSYANTELYTDSTYMSGFVYTNMSGGIISQSYAACTMKKESGETQNNAQQPFVGRDNKNKYLNAGTMENNYYLLNTDGSGDINQDFAQALNATNFKNANNLQGFVFVQSNVEEERQQGVWSHIDTKGNSLILPELMNANVIATSAKYLLSAKDENDITKYTYTNASSVTEGTRYNPYIIRNVQEFNATLTGNRVDMSVGTSKSGYIRLIDSINFGEDGDAIKTRINYTLGDDYRSNLTSFEGNGLNIEGIYFDNPQTQTNSMGLFSKIQNAYVKNVNLSFVKPKNGVQYGTTNVKYSGGLSGIITNSAIINVNLDGSDVSLTGQNYVGGLAGLLNGDSLLYGITSNLSVSADSSETALYYSEEDYIALANESDYNQYINKLSYAGGIAGVIDITKRAGTEYNVSYIDVYGDQMFVKATEEQLPNIEGQYAGGIAGFAGSNVSALKLKYHTGVSDWISGNVAAGGIFGVSLGKIMASQVTAVEDTQFEYDTEFGKYVLNIKDEKPLDRTKVGNLNLIESNGYAGGLIGIGLNANIDASYAKAGFKNGVVIGGLIGLAVASNVTYSYAVPFVNLTNTTKEVGGLFGSAHIVEKGVNYNSDPLKTYKELVKVYLNRDAASSSTAYTDIQYTFSTLLVEKSQLEDLKVDSSKTSDNDIKLGYLVPNSSNNANVNALRSGGFTTYSYVYEGRLEDYSDTCESTSNIEKPIFETEKSKEAKLDVMYNLAHTTQETTFNEVFSSWKVIPYWTLNHEKYFPLLTNEGVENYILIKEANDLKQLASNPDGKFKVVQDINMSDITIEGNWVIGVEFRGELIGEIDSETQTRKKIYNITLNPNQADASSGFFKATKGAIISDLEFEWNDGGQTDVGAINSSVNLTDVSGLSCLDSYNPDGENTRFSEFRNIEVSVTNDGTPDNVEGNKGYLIQPGASNIKINSFGGIVASTQNSLIINCDFVGKVDVSLTEDTDPNNTVDKNVAYFGGLVGKAEKSLGDGSEILQNSSMSIMNSKVGANGESTSKTKTSFNVTVAGATQANIGGAIGHITNTSVLGVSIGGVQYENTDYQAIKINVELANNLSNKSSQHIAGLIGYCYEKSSVDGSNADVNIIVKGGSADSDKNYSSNIAGLIGTYNGKMYIVNSNSKATIDVSDLKTDTLLIAGGVASLSSEYSEDAIKQCLFTGSIIGENEDAGTIKQTEATQIIAGGAVAKTIGTMTIEETMTTVDVTIGADKLINLTGLYAGGFVGKVSGDGSTLTLNNVVSSGKLVPFGGNSETNVHLGGMIGSVDKEYTNTEGKHFDTCGATITNSYTVTSIIADAIAGKALQHTSSDALVGYAEEGKVAATNVYYSTDFALTTNDHNYGNNIAGSDFVLSKNYLWKTEFVEQQLEMWKYIQESDNYGYLPYIKALEDSLKVYKVLQIDNGKHNYVEGTSLRPKTFTGDFDTNFTYYILDDITTLAVDTVKNLNGVLIGEDVELTTNTGNLISSIGKHSAVSNIHLNIVSPGSITLDGGFIVNENNGLIFNCSVQGQGININGSIGVIAGANNGTISHSYSGIEILNSGAVGGIAYTNNRVINSCYFTGYINSSGASAGIMLAVSPEQKENAYVYNNYMAGVITNISNDGTSFYAGDFVDDSRNCLIDGLNNYIDKFANNESIKENYEETTSTTRTIQVLTSVETSELMSRPNPENAIKYAGSWYTTVKTDKTIITTSNKDGVITSNEAGSDEKEFSFEYIGSFGYNYGYPIYKFNKLNKIDSDLSSCSDIAYSVETGTGETSETDLSVRYGKLSSAESSMYNNAYKIPHLGVFSALHGLQKTSRNYVIIYDINGRVSHKDTGAMIEWNGICSESATNEGFAKTGAFNGVLVTNKNLANTLASGEYICTIEGLNKSGLFNEIGKSYIADIKLGNFGEEVAAVDDKPAIQGLTNSGAIGTTIVDETTINNISFENNSTIIGNNFGGLFGSVQSSVTIQNFNSSNGTAATLILQGINNESTAGLIAKELNGGTINLVNDTSTTPPIANALYPFFKGVGTAGGLVGQAISGTINANNNIVNINNNTTGTIGSYGGIVGSVSTASDKNVTIKGVKVNFISGAVIPANSFGGFVSKVEGTVTLEGCSIDGSNLKINSESSVDSQKGLLVGKISSGEVTIKDFTLSQEIKITYTGSNGANSSIGGFVGTQIGDFNLGISRIEAITIEAQNTPNLGGIIGIYGDDEDNTYVGNINITGQLPSMVLNGYQNVGGFIGQANAWPKIGVDEETEIETASEDTLINFLNTSKYAKIQITKFASTNIGGLFGLLKEGNSIINSETGLIDNYIEVLNNNEFEIKDDNVPKDRTVTNIGGVAGFVDKADAVFGNLKNEVNIDGTAKTNFIFKNVGGIFGNFKGASITTATNSGAIKFANIVGSNDAISNAKVDGDTGKVADKAYLVAINVGGVIGLVENGATFTDFTNSKEVSGYQNVGGLIGYGDNIQPVPTESESEVVAIETSTGSSSSGTVAGVINVGGAFGCVQNSKIENIESTAKVYGNTNVGGLIGLSNYNTLMGNIVEGSSSETELIKAIYYNVYTLNSTTAEHISYIPTGVGGLIGASQTTTIEANTVQNVNITSTDEGKETGSVNSNSKGMISTISNYMANVGSGTGSKLNDFVTSEAIQFKSTDSKLEFAKLTSGFGGFIGTLDNTNGIVVETEESEEPEVETSSTGEEEPKVNSIKNLTIKAPLGINVGTYYGVYKHNGDFNAPKLEGTINIDGAYNVGGIAGKTTGDINSFKNSDLTGNATINLQSRLSGMYIGGLFGEINSNIVSEIKIVDSNIDIVIYTNSSYYIGGLVGKLSISSGNTFNGDATNVQVAANNDDAQNFGGLVGMFKITGTADGETYSVNGKHMFPFTVNTIENQNYADGLSNFDLEAEENTLKLMAQANYINQDSFNISATSAKKYFDKEANGDAIPHNPLLSSADSWGWSKEYTGFKQIQRCIPQSNTWDSIAVVYNAEWITEVGTIGNLGLNQGDFCDPSCSTEHSHTTIRKDADGKLSYWKGSDQVIIDDQHIVYTIYKKSQDVEMLYSAIGIAEIAKIGDAKVNNGDNSTSWYDKEDLGGTSFEDNTVTIAEYYFMRNVDENMKLFGYYNDQKDGKSLQFVYTENVNDEFPTSNKIRPINSLNSKDLLYFNWSGKTDFVHYRTQDSEGGGTLETKQMVKLHYYKSNSKYYDFRVIYANSSLSEYRVTQDNVPNSGSVFEIYGVNPSLYSSYHEEGPTWWERNGWWVIALGEIALAFLTWGASKWITAAVKVGKLAKLARAAAKTASFFKKHTKLLRLVKNAGKIALAANVLWLGGMATAEYQESKTTLRKAYFEIQNQNIGLLTTSTYSTIRYKNNVLDMNPNIVLTKTDNGEEYTFYYYSNVKPSDYYANYYIIPKESINNDSLDLELTQGISKDNPNISVRPDNDLSFNYNTGTEVVIAELKYIYHEGAYYYNSRSAKLEHYRTQELSDPSLVTTNENEIYYLPDGTAYVRGTYSNGTYTFIEEETNNVYIKGGEYKLNGKPISNPTQTPLIEYVGVGGGIVSGTPGYDYLSNAYYTTLGTPDTSTEKTYTKYATFSYWGPTTIDTTGYTLGVDYIQASYTLVENVGVGNGTHYKEGEDYILLQDSEDEGNDLTDEEKYNEAIYRLTSNQPAYFKISSMSDSGTTSSSLGSLTRDELEDAEIILAAYPTCFKDPYTIKPTGNYKDSYNYIAKATNPDVIGPIFGFPVTYYYFEGGYKSWQGLSNSTDTTNVLYNSIYTPININEGVDSGYVTVYDSSGTEKVLKLYKNKDGEDFEYLIIKDGTNYKLNSSYANYYISPVNDYTTEDGGDDLKRLQLVSSNYIVTNDEDGSIVWNRAPAYMLDDQGYVNKLYESNPTVEKGTYAYNKFLTYTSSTGYKDVYTMFKYTMFENANSNALEMNLYFDKPSAKEQTSVWYNIDKNENYYLIPTELNRSRPNPGFTDTILLESCNVVLGGNANLYYTKGGKANSPVVSGNITIS